ncbi:Flp pilus assembly protein TadG [Sinomonas atrocyanea]|uniref:TadE/TadG family type IV pilus assembly protein n=1 Tax=Sinomonas atrocyanea TaxID=37927 RepID=UPI00277E3DD4|nr:TadE family type IV pilus minor pilin [Sinomonas atrocyanea]MDQ0258726.1 Flp pilus assembly protein TadG [Sinomonas atrocyanea]
MKETSHRRERGAVAVEFALVLPLLLGLVLGIVEFGRIYNAQVLATNAAREAARTVAIGNSQSQAITNAQSVAPGYTISVTVPTSCTPGTEVQATVTTNVQTVSGTWFGLPNPVNVNGTGAMRCNG